MMREWRIFVSCLDAATEWCGFSCVAVDDIRSLAGQKVLSANCCMLCRRYCPRLNPALVLRGRKVVCYQFVILSIFHVLLGTVLNYLLLLGTCLWWNIAWHIHRNWSSFENKEPFAHHIHTGFMLTCESWW